MMMGCFIGIFGLRKRSKRWAKATDDPKQTEQVRIFYENAVANSHGYQRATSLERRGRGTFGTSYEANLEIGTPMVIKKLREFYGSEINFGEMLDANDKMYHQNLFPLTAYYCSKDGKLLAYDYMPIGSLYALLHGNSVGRSPLQWDERTSIALGAARAIAHIHSQSPTRIHGNIKSSNILLTKTIEACVTDYGLTEYWLTHVDGLMPAANRVDGYHAHEVTFTSKVSQKDDEYSFGVLFLELLTGKDPTESYLKDEEMDLPEWMTSAVNDEWTTFDVELLQHENVEVLLQYLELVYVWTARDPDIRPSMAQVITQIEKLGCSSSHIHETFIEIEDHESFNVPSLNSNSSSIGDNDGLFC